MIIERFSILMALQHFLSATKEIWGNCIQAAAIRVNFTFSECIITSQVICVIKITSREHVMVPTESW